MPCSLEFDIETPTIIAAAILGRSACFANDFATVFARILFFISSVDVDAEGRIAEVVVVRMELIVALLVLRVFFAELAVSRREFDRAMNTHRKLIVNRRNQQIAVAAIY